MLHKLHHLVGDSWEPLSYPAVYRRETMTDGNDRIVATVPRSDPAIFMALAEQIAEPYCFLYVLITPRGEGEPGRYESEPLDAGQVRDFLFRFGSFLQQDSRCSLWLHSFADGATVVWDHHDLIFGYGPLDRYVAALDFLGFQVGEPAIPFPHSHNYHVSLDAEATEILEAFDWLRKSLQPEDD